MSLERVVKLHQEGSDCDKKIVKAGCSSSSRLYGVQDGAKI